MFPSVCVCAFVWEREQEKDSVLSIDNEKQPVFNSLFFKSHLQLRNKHVMGKNIPPLEHVNHRGLQE